MKDKASKSEKSDRDDVGDTNDEGKKRENITSNLRVHVAKRKRHASSCNKCDFETKNEGKLTDHVAKQRAKKVLMTRVKQAQISKLI